MRTKLKVRTKLKACLVVAALTSAMAMATPAHAGSVSTYYVDAANGSDTKGNGSSARPWKTISMAASKAGAGDTVRIRSGIYRETVRPARSGTAGHPVTFEPDTGANVTVSGANLVTGSWSPYSGNVYQTDATLPMGDYLNSVYVDGVANNLARSPNTPVGNLYDPVFWDRNASASNAGLLNDPVNLNQPDGTWDGAALFVEDAGSWNFSSALVGHSTPGNLTLDRSQGSYAVKLSSYDNAVTLVGPDGAVLGSHGMTVTPNTGHRVRVSAVGSQIRVYMDDAPDPVISATDGQVSEGSFGLGVASSSGDVAARADFTNVNAKILSADPAHQPDGLAAPTFASNINGWTKPEDTGWWESDGRVLHGYTQPQTGGTSAVYETTQPAKDFTYSADVKLTTPGVASLTFRKQLQKGYVIDLADWGLGGSEYYVMGKLAALDYPGEWYYDSAAHRLYLETTGTDSPASHTVEYKARNLAFDLTERSDILVKGVKLFAATIDTARGSDNVIDGINAKYVSEYNLQYNSRGTGICLCGTNDTLKNSEIAYSSGSLVTLKGDGHKLVNNLIHDGTYGGIVFNSAIELLGRYQLISNNTVYNSGRSLIGGDFFADDIQYNDFHDGNYFAHDTGMLYTAHDDLGNSEIHHNYWHDNPHRSNGEGDWTGGVYLDESSANALIYDNVTWNLTWQGIVVNHVSDFVGVYNNTTVNNSSILVSEPSYGIDAYGDRIVNNIATQGLGTGASSIGATFSSNLSSGDPQFVDPSAKDFRLQENSPARNVGTRIRGITDNYEGIAPDIGAYEVGRPAWTAGHDFANPPNPTYHLVDTDFKNLVVNGSLDLNRIGDPRVNSLFGWTRTNAKTAQPTYDYAGDTSASRYHYETSVALGTGQDGIEQTITGLTPNTTYRIKGYLRAKSDGQSVRLGVKDYGGPDTYQESTSTSWADQTLSFATGPTNTSATIYAFKPTTGGYAFVDDIMMDAPPITLNVNDVAVPEGNSGTTPATFTVTLNPPSLGTVTVDYATADGTAVAPDDYTATSGTLRFAPGETSKTVSVSVNGDTVDEPDERFTLTLSNATGGATIGRGTGAGTITNDEPPPPGVTRVNDHTTGTGLNEFEFVGSWATNTNPTAYQQDVTFSQGTDDYYQVRFNGTKVQLYSEIQPVAGIMGVSIDGGPETMVDTYSPTDLGNMLVYTSPGMAAGPHTLKVRVTGTKNPDGVGYWIVADRVDITS